MKRALGGVLAGLCSLLSALGSAQATPPPPTPDAEYEAICGPAAPQDDASDVYLNVEDFGALGGDEAYDGPADNDLAGLRLAAAALCDRSGGETRRKTLYFPNGTYHLEGSRSFYDTSYADWGVLYDRCTNVRIFGCGSTIEIVPFDRTWLDAGPPYDGFFFASEYQMMPFLLDRAQALELRGFMLDGNAESIVQEAIINAEGLNVGVVTLACSDYRMTDVEARFMLTDGFLIGHDLPADRDFAFDNIRGYNNCRTGLALIQANHGTVSNSVMNATGDCGALTWDGENFGEFQGFSPRAGVGIEPDCGFGVPGCELFTEKLGNIVFDNLHAEGNWGFGLASAHSNGVENITVRNSALISTPPGSRGSCSATAGLCDADLDCPAGETCVYAYCAPDPGQGLAGDGECSDPLWLFDGLAENLSIHTSRGRIVLAGGLSEAGDHVIFRNNVIYGGSVLLHAHGTYKGPSEVEITGNDFFAVAEHGPAEPLPLISITDVRSCNTRSWRFSDNYVQIPEDHRGGMPYFNATTVLGLLAESTGNTFASFDPFETFYMSYDDTFEIADTLAPTAAWEPLGLAACIDQDGLVAYDEANAPGCEDPAFAACDGIAGEVSGLWFDDAETLHWWPEYQAGTYRIYRDDLSTLSSGTYGQCAQSGIVATLTTDLTVPAPGVGWFYLVTSVGSSGSEGTKGYATAGERLGDVCL